MCIHIYIYKLYEIIYLHKKYKQKLWFLVGTTEKLSFGKQCCLSMTLFSVLLLDNKILMGTFIHSHYFMINMNVSNSTKIPKFIIH